MARLKPEINPTESVFLGWTPAEDANLIWLLMSCPFTDHSKPIVSYFPFRAIQEIFQRYNEILESKELSQRVIKEANGDILTYKPIPWTKSEFCSLARLSDLNGKCLPSQFLASFPSLFHPARYAGSLLSTYNRLRNHGQNSYSIQNQIFQEFRSQIQKEIQGIKLESFPSLSEDPELALRNIIQSDESLTSQSNSIFSIQTLIQKQMSKKTFAALVGIGSPRFLNRTKTSLGRSSPKIKPDIDLSDLNIQTISRKHCNINVCSDLNLYLEVLSKNVIINGVVFQRNAKIRLQNGDILDIGGAPFVFIENIELLTTLRQILRSK